MALTDIPFKPGIYTETTDRGVGKLGYWKDCDKVRFVDGHPQKMGGWTKDTTDDFLGIARSAVDWKPFSSSNIFVGIGTHLKLYIWNNGTFSDITPYRETGTLSGPFDTTSGLYTVTVNDAGHGLSAGDYVHFSGATAGGGITIDGEYTVTSVTSSSAYVITHSVSASSTASGTGGASVAYSYEISIGSADSTLGYGWGAGSWGAETWGTARTTTTFLTLARIWSLATWGEDMVACPRGGKIYAWDSSVGTGTRATLITNAPSTNRAIFVSQEDRHLVALGAHDGSADDPMLIRWCDAEDYTNWTPSLTNTAGDKRLDLGNEIYCGLPVRGETLIFTDTHVYGMVFSGGVEVFTFRTIGDNGGLRGPNAVYVSEGIAYWMGDRNFFFYDGLVKVLECPVLTHVFGDINTDQKAKIFCGMNREFREIWWLYPSGDSMEIDRYVIYNLQDKVWYYGTLARTVMVGDSDVLQGVYAAGTNGYMYYHDSGVDDDGSAMESWLESGDVEISETGEQMMHVSKYIPDFQTLDGNMEITFTGKRYPQDSETQASGPHSFSSATKFINPRMRARQLYIRMESNEIGGDWRSGHIRIDLLPHGKR